jgi:capsular polysaccharide biosynthesis protein
MSDRPDVSAIGTSYYAYVVRRQWTVIAAGALLGVLAASGFLLVRPPVTTAIATVTVRPITVDAFEPSSQSLSLFRAPDETALAESRPVAESAAETLGIDPGQVTDAVSVTAVADSTLLEIAFTAATADDARSGADAVAEAFLAYRTGRADESRDAALADLDERLATLQALQQTADDSESEAAVSRSVDGEISDVLARETTLGQLDTTAGEVLTPAAHSAVTVSPPALLTILEGLLVGAVVGIIAAFVANSFDRRVRSAADIRHATGAPILGTVSSAHAAFPLVGTELAAVRTAAQRITAALPERARVLLVIDDTAAREASDIPANLAAALAETGRPVELVAPGLSARVRAALGAGFDLVRGASDDSPGTSLRSRRSRPLHVYLPAISPDDESLVPALTEELRTRISRPRSPKLFIVSVGSGTPDSVVLAILAVSDAVCAVAAAGESHTDELRFVVTESARAGAAFLGTVQAPAGRSLETDPLVSGDTARAESAQEAQPA